MRRSAPWISVFCLIIGFLLGIIFPRFWEEQSAPQPPAAAVNGESAALGSNQTGDEAGAAVPGQPVQPENVLDAQDNLSLLEAACAVNRALKERDWNALAALASPSRGVTFTPYSTVDFETDLTFTPAQLRDLEQDGTVYAWGFVDGRGSLIEMTIPQYLERYVYHTDYSKAPQMGIDQVLMTGNALENVVEAYPGCRFVDFSFPASAEDAMDWCSLKLVFEPGESGWLLVGVVHGEWTV